MRKLVEWSEKGQVRVRQEQDAMVLDITAMHYALRV